MEFSRNIGMKSVGVGGRFIRSPSVADRACNLQATRAVRWIHRHCSRVDLKRPEICRVSRRITRCVSACMALLRAARDKIITAPNRWSMPVASSRNQLPEYAETIGGLVVLRCHQKKEKPEKGRACSALQLIGFTLASLHMHRQTGDSVPWARESSHGKLDRPEEASACFSVDEGMSNVCDGCLRPEPGETR